jgi:flagellar basal body rod protein FlgG
MNTFEIAAIGLQQDTERLRVLSHNVANVTTSGYKRQVAVQEAYARAMQSELSAQSAMNTHTDMSMGKLRATGQPLDVALGEGEFLMVQLPTGATALSRGGSLQVDARGRLLTSGGLAVQGASGDVVVPVGAGSVRIDASGQVLADDKPAGALRVMRVAPDVALQPLGAGLYALPNGADAQAVQAPRVQAGYTEASNVVPAQEMVQVMATMRHAESMVRMLQGADEMLEKTIRKLGEM